MFEMKKSLKLKLKLFCLSLVFTVRNHLRKFANSFSLFHAGRSKRGGRKTNDGKTCSISFYLEKKVDGTHQKRQCKRLRRASKTNESVSDVLDMLFYFL